MTLFTVEGILSYENKRKNGEEASILLYTVLFHILRISKRPVNHSGDSDSTGSICGNIMGEKLGLKSIPKEWIDKLEISDLIEEMAEKLYNNIENTKALAK